MCVGVWVCVCVCVCQFDTQFDSKGVHFGEGSGVGLGGLAAR